MTQPNVAGASPAPQAAGATPEATRDLLAALTAPPVTPPAAPATPAAGTTPAATPATPGATPAEPDDKRAGSQASVLADLATERDARQAAQTQLAAVQAQMAAFLQAVTGKAPGDDATKADPAVVASEAKAAKLELAAVRAAPAGTDVVSLLDSRRFVDGLAAFDPSNTKDISEYISKYLTDNPTATGVRYAGGAGDVRAKGEPGAGSMDDLIRGTVR